MGRRPHRCKTRVSSAPPGSKMASRKLQHEAEWPAPGRLVRPGAGGSEKLIDVRLPRAAGLRKPFWLHLSIKHNTTHPAVISQPSGGLPPPRTPPQGGQIIAAPRGPRVAQSAAPGPGRRSRPGCSIILAYLLGGSRGRQSPRGCDFTVGWVGLSFTDLGSLNFRISPVEIPRISREMIRTAVL